MINPAPPKAHYLSLDIETFSSENLSGSSYFCCDECWAIMRDKITPNMDAEICFGKRLGLKIRYIKDLNQEVTNIERRL